MTTEPFEPIPQSDLIEPLADLLAAPTYAAWPDWAKARRAALMKMPHGQRPPEMAGSLYAMAKAGVDIGPEGWAALGQAATVTAQYQLTQMGQNGVAAALIAIARRERGEAGTWPAAQDDPPVDPAWATFVPQSEPEPDPE